ncbi:MAG: Flp pilus assembly complex ATPase component TadA [Gemmataceae bacterium]|nr:Flp pilus assembly complex ATPase component TadA [Gemmataceae bacterium]
MTRADVYRSTLRYFFAPVADLLYDDESVTEVLINGANQVYCERRGKLEPVDRRFADEQVLMAAVRNLAEYVGRDFDDRHSMDARLPEPEQFRVHVILPPTSRVGVCVSIRKFRKSTVTLDWLQSIGSSTPVAAEYLALMVKTHRNLIVSGGTGSGKTSLLNALSGEIPDNERVVVIEDSSELRLQQPHTVYLEAKPADADGKGGVTIRDLFVDSLRMRPDRILVGEVRRGEALDLIQSMLSGHDGALSTVHASSPLLALVRLETLSLINDVALPVYVARTQVASAIHVVAQVSRLSDGSRRVIAISEVAGLGKGERYRIRPIFEHSSAAGLQPTGKRSRFAREILASEHAHRVRETRDVFEESARTLPA